MIEAGFFPSDDVKVNGMITSKFLSWKCGDNAGHRPYVIPPNGVKLPNIPLTISILVWGIVVEILMWKQFSLHTDALFQADAGCYMSQSQASNIKKTLRQAHSCNTAAGEPSETVLISYMPMVCLRRVGPK